MIKAGLSNLKSRTPSDHPLWYDVFLPFLGSRLLLTLFGYISTVFPAYFNYPGAAYIARGWQFTPWRWLDFWGRWDSDWYLNIIKNGYVLLGDPATTKSNIAFYPLYPYLVKGIAALWPGVEKPVGYLIIGLIISNIAALLALVLLYRLVIFVKKDRLAARHTIWLILAFPSGFILSCFYTEGIFLFLVVATFWWGVQKKWALACIGIALAALCRPVGIGLAAPLAYLYMERINWDFRKIRWDLLWFLLTPIGYLLFLYHIHQTTGNFLTTFQVQQAWDRHLSWPWKTLLNPYGWNIYHTPIQQLLTLVFFYGVYLAFKKLPLKSLTILAVVILLPIFLTGRLSSTPRFYLVVFPVFMAYAYQLENKWILYGILLASSLLQLVYFMGWCRFYWIF